MPYIAPGASLTAVPLLDATADPFGGPQVDRADGLPVTPPEWRLLRPNTIYQSPNALRMRTPHAQQTHPLHVRLPCKISPSQSRPPTHYRRCLAVVGLPPLSHFVHRSIGQGQCVRNVGHLPDSETIEETAVRSENPLADQGQHTVLDHGLRFVPGQGERTVLGHCEKAGLDLGNMAVYLSWCGPKPH